MHSLRHLCLESVPSVEILHWFLHRIPNLERLQLHDPDHSIRELVPSGNTTIPQQRVGTVLQFTKELASYRSGINDIGFERDAVLRRVECLVLYSCHSLINFAHHTVSFTQLTYLAVQSCFGLKSLMSSSTAKSLVRLTTMMVICCGELEEIVTNNEGNAEERVVNIVFDRLVTIELWGLTKLTSFCSYKNCECSLPSLEKLILRDCPKMKTFTEKSTKAPKLQNVFVVDGKEKGKWYWEGDLNSDPF